MPTFPSSDSSFCDLGVILWNGLPLNIPEGYVIEQIYVQNRLCSVLCQYSDDTFLVPIRGMGVVALVDKSEVVNLYTLDRTVRINAGVPLAVLPCFMPFTYLLIYKGKGKSVASSSMLKAYDLPYEINIGKIHSFFYQEKGRHFIFPGESHDFWEMTYIDQGTLFNCVSDIPYKMTQGDLMFISSNQWHAQNSPPGQIVTFLTVSFDLFFCDSERLTNIVINANKSIQRWIRLMLDIQANNDLYLADYLTSIIKLIIIESIRITTNNPMINARHIETSLNRHTKDQITIRAMNYIEKNINRKIITSEIAKEISVNPSYLASIFKCEIGKSITQYIEQEKLKCAKQYIRSGQYSISQIADLLDYSSIQYFSTRFKKTFGMSPLEYSRTLKNN